MVSLIYLRMMEPENGIKSRVVEVRHVTIVASDGMNNVVKRLETVGVGRCTRDPGLITEL